MSSSHGMLFHRIKKVQGDRRESDGFQKKVLGRFSTWNGCIFTKL